ncbi:MAG: anthranilate phosphoribosyltransferase [Paludibacteraceae bacterium]|nr:anthranilate phosphoribosyltransferase [Paludibacteraceae bacterium]
MKQILSRLVLHEELTSDETEQILIGITQGKYSNEQISALIMALQMRGITVDELLGFRRGILKTGVAVDLSPYKPIDIVGTGGDGKNTFNISTCACFVVAGAGYKVAKHGNYAATSVSGASNVIEAHGVKFTNDNDKLKRSIEECGFVYQHAQLFATAMKYVGGIRKSLQIPTFFNLLGPIVNPCQPSYQLLGVANLDQMRLYSNVYQKMGIGYGIVNSIDGYDEISLTGDFKVVTNNMEKVYKPSDVNMPISNVADLSGSSRQTLEDAKEVFDAVLEGTATESQINVVLINAAFAIKVMEPNKDIEECIAIATESLKSGKALGVLKKYVELNS